MDHDYEDDKMYENSREFGNGMLMDTQSREARMIALNQDQSSSKIGSPIAKA